MHTFKELTRFAHGSQRSPELLLCRDALRQRSKPCRAGSQEIHRLNHFQLLLPSPWVDSSFSQLLQRGEGADIYWIHNGSEYVSELSPKWPSTQGPRYAVIRPRKWPSDSQKSGNLVGAKIALWKGYYLTRIHTNTFTTLEIATLSHFLCIFNVFQSTLQSTLGFLIQFL